MTSTTFDNIFTHPKQNALWEYLSKNVWKSNYIYFYPINHPMLEVFKLQPKRQWTKLQIGIPDHRMLIQFNIIFMAQYDIKC